MESDDRSYRRLVTGVSLVMLGVVLFAATLSGYSLGLHEMVPAVTRTVEGLTGAAGQGVADAVRFWPATLIAAGIVTLLPIWRRGRI